MNNYFFFLQYRDERQSKECQQSSSYEIRNSTAPSSDNEQTDNEQTDRQSSEFTVRELLQIQDIWIRVSYLQQCFQSRSRL